MPESFTYDCNCEPLPGTVPPIANYVVSIAGLRGIISLGDTGSLVWRTENNTIYGDFTASAGLGSVTSVAVSSPNSNLIVSSGSPVTTSGTIVIDLDLALESIAGLTTAADKMIYTTASNVYATTDLTAFARTLLDDAAATNARTTLGLVIGTNVQAWNAELDRFVTDFSNSASDWTLTGTLTIAGDLTAAGAVSFTDVVTIGDTLSVTNGITSGATITGTLFDGSGANLTNLNATQLSSGVVAVSRGGTGLISYAVGDIIYASAATTIQKLAAVSAGSYLRSAGVTTAPAWSTLKLPNSATVGDILYSNTTNNISNLAGVATGNALISGGVATAPSWGKITSSHVDSATIATIVGGSNSNIGSFANDVTFLGAVQVNGTFNAIGEFWDANGVPGNAGDIFTSTGTGSAWTNQIAVSTLRIDTSFSTEGTLTPGGTTGAQTINKTSGTVRFAGAASSLVVTNNLCTTSSRVLATVCTNDATAYVKNVTCTNGSFTITLGAAATGETECFWELFQIT